MATSGSGADDRLTGNTNPRIEDKQPSGAHGLISDQDVAHLGFGEEGLHLAATDIPRATNFHPKSLNNVRKLLKTLDKPHPASGTNTSTPRQLDRRGSTPNMRP